MPQTYKPIRRPRNWTSPNPAPEGLSPAEIIEWQDGQWDDYVRAQLQPYAAEAVQEENAPYEEWGVDKVAKTVFGVLDFLSTFTGGDARMKDAPVRPTTKMEQAEVTSNLMSLGRNIKKILGGGDTEQYADEDILLPNGKLVTKGSLLPKKKNLIDQWDFGQNKSFYERTAQKWLHEGVGKLKDIANDYEINEKSIFVKGARALKDIANDYEINEKSIFVKGARALGSGAKWLGGALGKTFAKSVENIPEPVKEGAKFAVKAAPVVLGAYGALKGIKRHYDAAEEAFEAQKQAEISRMVRENKEQHEAYEAAQREADRRSRYDKGFEELQRDRESKETFISGLKHTFLPQRVAGRSAYNEAESYKRKLEKGDEMPPYDEWKRMSPTQKAEIKKENNRKAFEKFNSLPENIKQDALYRSTKQEKKEIEKGNIPERWKKGLSDGKLANEWKEKEKAIYNEPERLARSEAKLREDIANGDIDAQQFQYLREKGMTTETYEQYSAEEKEHEDHIFPPDFHVPSQKEIERQTPEGQKEWIEKDNDKIYRKHWKSNFEKRKAENPAITYTESRAIDKAKEEKAKKAIGTVLTLGKNIQGIADRDRSKIDRGVSGVGALSNLYDLLPESVQKTNVGKVAGNILQQAPQPEPEIKFEHQFESGAGRIRRETRENEEVRQYQQSREAVDPLTLAGAGIYNQQPMTGEDVGNQFEMQDAMQGNTADERLRQMQYDGAVREEQQSRIDAATADTNRAYENLQNRFISQVSAAREKGEQSAFAQTIEGRRMTVNTRISQLKEELDAVNDRLRQSRNKGQLSFNPAAMKSTLSPDESTALMHTAADLRKELKSQNQELDKIKTEEFNAKARAEMQINPNPDRTSLGYVKGQYKEAADVGKDITANIKDIVMDAADVGTFGLSTKITGNQEHLNEFREQRPDLHALSEAVSLNLNPVGAVNKIMKPVVKVVKEAIPFTEAAKTKKVLNIINTEGKKIQKSIDSRIGRPTILPTGEKVSNIRQKETMAGFGDIEAALAAKSEKKAVGTKWSRILPFLGAADTEISRQQGDGQDEQQQPIDMSGIPEYNPPESSDEIKPPELNTQPDMPEPQKGLNINVPEYTAEIPPEPPPPAFESYSSRTEKYKRDWYPSDDETDDTSFNLPQVEQGLNVPPMTYGKGTGTGQGQGSGDNNELAMGAVAQHRGGAEKGDGGKDSRTKEDLRASMNARLADLISAAGGDEDTLKDIESLQQYSPTELEHNLQQTRAKVWKPAGLNMPQYQWDEEVEKHYKWRDEQTRDWDKKTPKERKEINAETDRWNLAHNIPVGDEGKTHPFRQHLYQREAQRIREQRAIEQNKKSVPDFLARFKAKQEEAMRKRTNALSLRARRKRRRGQSEIEALRARVAELERQNQPPPEEEDLTQDAPQPQDLTDTMQQPMANEEAQAQADIPPEILAQSTAEPIPEESTAAINQPPAELQQIGWGRNLPEEESFENGMPADMLDTTAMVPNPDNNPQEGGEAPQPNIIATKQAYIKPTEATAKATERAEQTPQYKRIIAPEQEEAVLEAPEPQDITDTGAFDSNQNLLVDTAPSELPVGPSVADFFAEIDALEAAQGMLEKRRLAINKLKMTEPEATPEGVLEPTQDYLRSMYSRSSSPAGYSEKQDIPLDGGLWAKENEPIDHLTSGRFVKAPMPPWLKESGVAPKDWDFLAKSYVYKRSALLQDFWQADGLGGNPKEAKRLRKEIDDLNKGFEEQFSFYKAHRKPVDSPEAGWGRAFDDWERSLSYAYHLETSKRKEYELSLRPTSLQALQKPAGLDAAIAALGAEPPAPPANQPQVNQPQQQAPQPQPLPQVNPNIQQPQNFEDLRAMLQQPAQTVQQQQQSGSDDEDANIFDLPDFHLSYADLDDMPPEQADFLSAPLMERVPPKEQQAPPEEQPPQQDEIPDEEVPIDANTSQFLFRRPLMQSEYEEWHKKQPDALKETFAQHYDYYLKANRKFNSEVWFNKPDDRYIAPAGKRPSPRVTRELQREEGRHEEPVKMLKAGEQPAEDDRPNQYGFANANPNAEEGSGGFAGGGGSGKYDPHYLPIPNYAQDPEMYNYQRGGMPLDDYTADQLPQYNDYEGVPFAEPIAGLTPPEQAQPDQPQPLSEQPAAQTMTEVPSFMPLQQTGATPQVQGQQQQQQSKIPLQPEPKKTSFTEPQKIDFSGGFSPAPQGTGLYPAQQALQQPTSTPDMGFMRQDEGVYYMPGNDAFGMRRTTPSTGSGFSSGSGGYGGGASGGGINIVGNQPQQNYQQPQQQQGGGWGNTVGNIIGGLGQAGQMLSGGLNMANGVMNLVSTGKGFIEDMFGITEQRRKDQLAEQEAQRQKVRQEAAQDRAQMTKEEQADQQRRAEAQQYSMSNSRGTVEWVTDPDGTRRQVTKLDDYGQAQKDAAAAAMGKLGDSNQYAQDAADAVMNQYDRRTQEANEERMRKLEESLVNQGLRPDSAAYRAAMKREQDAQADARQNAFDQSISQGYQYGQQGYRDQLATWQALNQFQDPSELYKEMAGANAYSQSSVLPAWQYGASREDAYNNYNNSAAQAAQQGAQFAQSMHNSQQQMGTAYLQQQAASANQNMYNNYNTYNQNMFTAARDQYNNYNNQQQYQQDLINGRVDANQNYVNQQNLAMQQNQYDYDRRIHQEEWNREMLKAGQPSAMQNFMGYAGQGMGLLNNAMTAYGSYSAAKNAQKNLNAAQLRQVQGY